MPPPSDLTWIKSAANELNNLLQVITESSQFLQRYAGGNPEALRYYDMMRSAVDRATELSRTLIERSVQSGGPVAPSPEPRKMPAYTPGEPTDVEIMNPEGTRELILIVDDEQFVKLLAQRVLTDEGYRVVTAKDGFEALDIYKKLHKEIALILLDFTMPVMDGSEVFSELRMINPQVPVVLSSGFTEQDKLKWMLGKGLRGFIPKPYTKQKLLVQIRSTLDAMKNEPRR